MGAPVVAQSFYKTQYSNLGPSYPLTEGAQSLPLPPTPRGSAVFASATPSPTERSLCPCYPLPEISFKKLNSDISRVKNHFNELSLINKRKAWNIKKFKRITCTSKLDLAYLVKDHQFVFTTWRFRTKILLYFMRYRLIEKRHWQTNPFRLFSFNTS